MAADDLDYYELLGVDITATQAQIKKAYRKKSLAVHPDKNPSADAAVLFDSLTKARDVLLDDTRRVDYDKQYRAKLERRKKQQEMDSKRRKAQEELEAMESQAKKAKTEQKQAEAQYAAEMARLRENRERKLREEEEHLERERRRRQEQDQLPETKEADLALKFKWKKKKHLTTEDLDTLLTPLGAVDVAPLTDDRKNRTIAVFNTVVEAHAVMTSKDTNPALAVFESIDWATGQEPAIISKMKLDQQRKKEAQQALAASSDLRSSTSSAKKPLFKSSSQSSFFKNIKIPPMGQATNTANLSHEDYEALTMMKLRQAQQDRLAGEP
ncbi:DnaJ-domain-containing protein [Hesseltinella vesiculosa]|uniref:DnaJ-domain-containing protein n=1 Tax=Hesseltinella vesiculosa TaxID=101127 RepID=A0A1X2GBC0_9FUNG|nr:DnaJ-domain-containing protein [Hesseltinella vesiculosa]